MYVKILVLQNWGKMAHLPQPTTETSFGNFMYTIIVRNKTLKLYQISSLEANFSSKDIKKFCTAVDRQKPLPQVLYYPTAAKLVIAN